MPKSPRVSIPNTSHQSTAPSSGAPSRTTAPSRHHQPQPQHRHRRTTTSPRHSFIL
ncbi:hypothetical protein U1Q18_039591, partial [Sarracenia purpurea var. burkii]